MIKLIKNTINYLFAIERGDMMAKWGTVNPPKETGEYLISCYGTVYIADRIEYPKGYWCWDTRLMGNKYDSETQGWQKLPRAIKL